MTCTKGPRVGGQIIYVTSHIETLGGKDCLLLTYLVDSEVARWRTVVGLAGTHKDQWVGRIAERCTGMAAAGMVVAGTAVAVAVVVAVAVAVAGKGMIVVGTDWS